MTSRVTTKKGLSNKNVEQPHFFQNVYKKRDFKAYEARESGVYLSVNEHFEGERNVAFKRGQRVLAHFAERSNEKELNAEITLLDTLFFFIC